MKLIEYISYLTIPLMIGGILIYGIYKKQPVYDTFIVGASEGMKIVVKIFPTMLAIIVAINVFRVSGAMDLFVKLISPISSVVGIPDEVVPLGVMSSISGGATLGLLSDTLETHGPDSRIGQIASTIMGSSETTFYVIAVYSASVGLRNIKYTLWIAIFCDIVAVIMAVLMCNILI